MCVRMLKYFVVFCILCSVLCQDDLGPECDTKSLLDSKTSTIMTRDELCRNQVCIIRYCPEPNTIWFIHPNKTEECRTLEDIRRITNTTFQLPNLEVFKLGSDGSLTENKAKSFFNDFRHVSYSNRMMYSSKNCSQVWLKRSNAKYLILEDGGLFRTTQRGSNINVSKESYVVEFLAKLTIKNKLIVKMVIKFLYSKAKDDFRLDIYNAIGMAISSFFLIIVLVIYSILPKLQNLPGLMLMAYVASLAVGFGMKTAQTTVQLMNLSYTTNCQIMSPTWYYGVLASFFWMNAMSFDIFWIFWATYKTHPRNKRSLRKFGLYSLYGFGMPLLIVIIAVTLDQIDLPKDTAIKKPCFDLCFPTSVNGVYIYIPVITLLCCNFLLFVLTSLKICLERYRLTKMLGSVNSKNTKKEKARFVTYVKLSLVMGITWIMDPIGMILDLPDWLSFIVSSNVFIGLAIFIIFICNRDVLVALSNKYSIGKKITARWASSFSHLSSKRSHRKKTDSAAGLSTNSTCTTPNAEVVNPF